MMPAKKKTGGIFTNIHERQLKTNDSEQELLEAFKVFDKVSG